MQVLQIKRIARRYADENERPPSRIMRRGGSLSLLDKMSLRRASENFDDVQSHVLVFQPFQNIYKNKARAFSVGRQWTPIIVKQDLQNF